MSTSFEGHHVDGQHQASKHSCVYELFFGCPMHGTFNVRCDLPSPDGIYAWPPTRTFDHPNGKGRAEVWLVSLNSHWRAWAYRWPGSDQRKDILELVTKRPLPDSLRNGEIEVEICDRWDQARVDAWCREHYTRSWHQSFPWSPARCDSDLIWNAIDTIDWSGLTVLDYGCAWGYHVMRSAAAGSYSVGFDRDHECISAARDVNDHIECQDARFLTEAPGGDWDAILYLSVHHQIDPGYDRLAETIHSLQRRCRRALFVELILPPMFGGGRKVEDVDSDVGGKRLLTYCHAVRGTRRIYQVEGKA